MGRDEFLAHLVVEFPEAAAQMQVAAQIREDEVDLLHCEVGAFRRATEMPMDAGYLWEAERRFQMVEALLTGAAPTLRNALEVSDLEDLALGECTPTRHHAVKERMSRRLRQVLIGHHEQWN